MGNTFGQIVRGTKTLRKGRFSGINQIYHINTCTIDREPVFGNFMFGRAAVTAMRREDDAGHTQTLAFVVMPDHLHWLFQLIGSRSLPTSVNTMKSFATRQINSLAGRKGRLWQKGYYDRAIRREEDIQAVARYIIANPIRAGITQSVRHYSLWDAMWV